MRRMLWLSRTAVQPVQVVPQACSRGWLRTERRRDAPELRDAVGGVSDVIDPKDAHVAAVAAHLAEHLGAGAVELVALVRGRHDLQEGVAEAEQSVEHSAEGRDNARVAKRHVHIKDGAQCVDRPVNVLPDERCHHAATGTLRAISGSMRSAATKKCGAGGSSSADAAGAAGRWSSWVSTRVAWNTRRNETSHQSGGAERPSARCF